MKRILLVDDDLDMTKIVSRWLEKAGYEVKVAISGYAAIDCLKASEYDLILLDYAMPDMNGEDTLKAIRLEGYDTKVLFRTGADDVDIKGSIDEYDALGYVSKADGKSKLLSEIAKVI